MYLHVRISPSLSQQSSTVPGVSVVFENTNTTSSASLYLCAYRIPVKSLYVVCGKYMWKKYAVAVFLYCFYNCCNKRWRYHLAYFQWVTWAGNDWHCSTGNLFIPLFDTEKTYTNTTLYLKPSTKAWTLLRDTKTYNVI